MKHVYHYCRLRCTGHMQSSLVTHYCEESIGTNTLKMCILYTYTIDSALPHQLFVHNADFSINLNDSVPCEVNKPWGISKCVFQFKDLLIACFYGKLEWVAISVFVRKSRCVKHRKLNCSAQIHRQVKTKLLGASKAFDRFHRPNSKWSTGQAARL